MAATLLLKTATWDLTLDVNGNIAINADPNSMAQDAASQIRLFLGEYWWDKTIGIPYFTQILGQNPPLSLLKQLLVNAALLVPGVASATVFLQYASATRGLSGQVQIVTTTGQTSAANFAVTSLQGSG